MQPQIGELVSRSALRDAGLSVAALVERPVDVESVERLEIAPGLDSTQSIERACQTLEEIG
jgi:hypothetical protein